MKGFFDIISFLIISVDLFKVVFLGLIGCVSTCVIIYFVKKIIGMLS